MRIIGLTGGIASGKNFISDIFKQEGAMIFDADGEVHNILKSDEVTITEVEKHFPQAVINGEVDRKILGKMVFADTEKLRILENILHPKVRERYRKFLELAENSDVNLVVLNIPLLLERRGYKCDKIVAVVTFPSLQKSRFLKRYKESNPKASDIQIDEAKERFEKIKAKQMSNWNRIKQSNFVIFNGFSQKCVIRKVKRIVRKNS